MSKYVCIYYGPYESFYTLSHKPQKLNGLKDSLLRRGFRVELTPVDYRNYCIIKMKDREVFRCNINNMMFNTDCSVDPVAQRALAAVLDASKRIQAADDYFWLRSIFVNDIVMALDHVPKNYWPKDNEECLCLTSMEYLSEMLK